MNFMPTTKLNFRLRTPTRLRTMRTRVLAVDLMLVHVFLQMHDLVEYDATNGAVVGLAFI